MLALRRLVDCLEGRWLQQLAALDGRGAAGADQGVQSASTAAWLRNRLRLGAGAASTAVRTARALFRGPLAATAQALTEGELSPAHAAVLASGTQDLAAHLTAEAEPVLVEAARRLDPPRLRRAVAHLRVVADPDNERRPRRTPPRAAVGCGWMPPSTAWWPSTGCWSPRPARPCWRPWSRWPARPPPSDTRSGGQRTADALAELARRHLEGGRLPQTGGVRPQLTVMVDLDSLLGRPGAVGGEPGWAEPLDPEGCRRLACDGAVTRVLVTRQPPGGHGPDDQREATTRDTGGTQGLATRLRTAMAKLPADPRGHPQPAAGGGAGHPGRPARPTGRPGRPRRRLCVLWL